MALAEFGDYYRRYMESTPGWIPKLNVDNKVSNQRG
jgi:protein-S-isoprenylcysteine O-methyltransferase Ste14